MVEIVAVALSPAEIELVNSHRAAMRAAYIQFRQSTNPGNAQVNFQREADQLYPEILE
jgi:hypothetical protein